MTEMCRISYDPYAENKKIKHSSSVARKTTVRCRNATVGYINTSFMEIRNYLLNNQVALVVFNITLLSPFLPAQLKCIVRRV